MGRVGDLRVPVKSSSGQVCEDNFFEETSLHGMRHINKTGFQKFLWIAVLVASLIITYSFFKGTIDEYLGDNMKITLNCTNNPMIGTQFPVVTICNNNLVSKSRAMANPNNTLTTFGDLKELSQPCDKLVLVCFFTGLQCKIETILTDNGWCCRISQKSEQSPYFYPSMWLILDAESYDYAYPSWYADGFVVTVNPHNTYPDFFGTSSFVAPGSNTMLRMYLEKTFTTNASLAQSPEKRQCFTKDEVVLKNFDMYTQQNCLIDGYIEAVKDMCGCVGRHRDFGSDSQGFEECTIRGGIGWMDYLDYEQCHERNTTLEEALNSAGCPSRCLVNCEDSRFSVEMSSGTQPGFAAFCGGRNMGDDFFDQLACMFSHPGETLGTKVCDTLHLYRSGKPEDEIHLRKRTSYCTPVMERVWSACRDYVEKDPSSKRTKLIQCIKANTTLDEMLEMNTAMNSYAQENLAILQVMAKGQYYTSIKRDVSYTFSSLIANIGGLLGLSMGCSIISIAELIILPLRQFVFITMSK